MTAPQDPLFRFFEREVKMGAKLLQDVRQDLADVVQVCEGKKKQTNYLRTLINELVKGTPGRPGLPKCGLWRCWGRSRQPCTLRARCTHPLCVTGWSCAEGKAGQGSWCGRARPSPGADKPAACRDPATELVALHGARGPDRHPVGVRLQREDQAAARHLAGGCSWRRQGA